MKPGTYIMVKPEALEGDRYVYGMPPDVGYLWVVVETPEGWSAMTPTAKCAATGIIHQWYPEEFVEMRRPR